MKGLAMVGKAKVWAGLAATSLLVGCGSDGGVESGETATNFSAIAPEETLRATGNEPFWSAEITGDEALYTTPENMDGERLAVQRFAGLGGLGLSGELADATRFDLAITEEPCDDTMSDRRYPFAAVLRLGDEVRQGCAWTKARPFTGDPTP